MATTTNPNGAQVFDAPFKQAKDAGEQILAAARNAGSLYVDSYEQAVEKALEVETRLASSAQPEWLRSMIEAHIDLSREFAGTYVKSARSVLK